MLRPLFTAAQAAAYQAECQQREAERARVLRLDKWAAQAERWLQCLLVAGLLALGALRLLGLAPTAATPPPPAERLPYYAFGPGGIPFHYADGDPQ